MVKFLFGLCLDRIISNVYVDYLLATVLFWHHLSRFLLLSSNLIDAEAQVNGYGELLQICLIER